MKDQQVSPIIRADGFCFTYPGEKNEALKELSFEVPAGAFLLVAGPGGSGKTTLLRALKEELKPAGIYQGSVEVDGETGFVMQDPSNQIVTGPSL